MTIHLKITISDIPSRDGEEVARQVERAISSVAGGIVQVDDLRDREALDAIATRLGTSAEWSGAADFLEDIANIIGETERPHPGGAADTYLQDFAQATGRTCPGAYDCTEDPS
jgi:hypothetical protein